MSTCQGERSANIQARNIVIAWANRGFTNVEAHAVFKNGEWTVKSNLVNGAPVGSTPEKLGTNLMGQTK